MVRFKVLGAIVFLLIGMVSCKNKPSAPDVSDVNVSLNQRLFFVDLFSGDHSDMASFVTKLSQQYGTYLEAYSQRVINIGGVDEPEYPARLKAFVYYEANQDVYAKCVDEFGNVDDLMSELTEGFKFYKHYFPKAPVPDIYFHISGFNQSIALDSAWISISVEKYLGVDCEFYEWLGIQQYLRKRMVREKITPDVFKAIAMTGFSTTTKNEDVLSQMIQQGKVLFFVRSMVPEMPEHLLFDYSPEELKWCFRYEADMWAGMVERKHLYESDRMTIQKYTGDAPFTAFFGQDSPGKAAVFIGYRIVEAYMMEHPELALSDLMLEQDGHKIFRDSRYRP